MTDIDKTSDKYQIVLKLINVFLVNMKKDKINDLLEFKDIDRKLLMSDKNKNAFTKMENKIYEQFDKTKCGWYRRKTTKNYMLTVIRYICADIGLHFTFKQKEIYVTVNEEQFRKSNTYYYIEYINI